MLASNRGRVLLMLAALAGFGLAGSAQRAPAAPFAPLSGWQHAVEQGNHAAIEGFYSQTPPPSYLTATGLVNGSAAETAFWESLAKSGLTSLTIELLSDQKVAAPLRQVYFEAEIRVNGVHGPQTYYTTVQQTWLLEPGGWRIIGGGRTDLTRLKQPESLDEPIYSKSASATADIAAAVKRAGVEHKRVLLDFGGNWCYDCHVLDEAFRNSQLAPLLHANYVLVDVDVEEFNYNLDIAKKYQVPLEKGVPALAVLDSDGRLLASQENGEFEAARRLSPDDLIAFLTQWKPQ